MNDEHKIVQQVYAAKEDVKAEDRLIGTYMPFIKTETAKFLKRPPVEGHDDELSIAMIAFQRRSAGIPYPWRILEVRRYADPKPPDRLQPKGATAQPCYFVGRTNRGRRYDSGRDTGGRKGAA